jgi:hypothetical protein
LSAVIYIFFGIFGSQDFRKKSTVQLGSDQHAAGLNISCHDDALAKVSGMKPNPNPGFVAFVDGGILILRT